MSSEIFHTIRVMDFINDILLFIVKMLKCKLRFTIYAAPFFKDLACNKGQRGTENITKEIGIMRQDTRDYQTIGVQAIYSNGELVYKDQQHKTAAEVNQAQGRDKTNVSNDRRT